MEPNLTGGGAGALIAALAYAGRLCLDWVKERRGASQDKVSTSVTNAETADALLLASLREEREGVQLLSGRVQELETQNAMLYEQMRKQRREYEAGLEALRRQLGDVSERLETLQTRLRTDDTA